MTRQILLTGANGFIGTQIARFLIKNKEHNILAMVRADNKQSAVKRLKRAWWDWPEIEETIEERVEVIAGDVIRENLGWDDETYSQRASSITHIIHTVADLRLHAPLKDLNKTNVQGTLNLLKLAKESPHLKRFSHLSTAYVAGKRAGEVGEDDLSDFYGFWSNYEESKYEAEKAVRKSKLPFSIFRPGMVVGNSKTGEIKTFNTLYILLKLYLTGKLRLIPTSSSLKLNPIPADYVARAVSSLTFNSRAEMKTFHLTTPSTQLPTIKEILEETRNWAKKELETSLPKPIFIPLSALIQKISAKSYIKPGLLKILLTLAPYLDEKRVFKNENTQKLLGSFEINWKDYLPHLLQYAVYHGFFHRSERTVHEQAFFRLKSRSYPIKFYDVVNGHVKEKSASSMHLDILKAVSSLQKLGVAKGDRVALVGLNSTRYLTLDIAMGLLGAVSVPLYYTSPPHEIKKILKSCGVKILFIGTLYLMNRLKELDLDFDVKIISFCRESQKIPDSALSWSSFLELGDFLEKINPTVDFNDLATIRYTSGTTGGPKGVTFNHENLRWMAESMASLPSWRDRYHKVRYLSFLPMNHVVEGILGTYSPYYAPAPLELYFLEDFNELPQTLPQIRPTIFFSVPRFYEKLWSKLKNSFMGQIYLQSPFIIKKFLRPLLRRIILYKAGLNHCKQLIVGSATSSKQLLYNFQDLGIEIHNAYGLTEAPLVTINRQGKNKIDTVGEPLPETKVTIKRGEVMIKGPQITPGYYEKNIEPLLENGWLKTGDLGYLTPDGYLVITGREKEILINSYGKSIDPLHIEALLRDIPHVEEVMLIGDDKPYLSAILWVDKDYNSEKIAQEIQKTNKDLSRPEQVKKWAVITNNLTIEGGDLTANMKLKREILTRNYQEVITALYQDPTASNVSYFGQVEANNEY